MAVAFNGLFLSRELSALCPALSFDTVALTNIAPDHLRMDKGKLDVDNNEIVANNANLGVDSTTGWGPNTELNADFNGTLEGGTLQDFDLTVNGVVIRRTSNRSNFKDWEDVVVFPIQSGQMGSMDVSYDDLFVESGVIYKYAIQPVSGQNRGPMTQPKSTIFDYSYSWIIGEEEKQLMFAFNPTITGYQTVVKDTLIETIGSKYPYVVRNANIGYRTFQFGATVTSFMDVDHTFMTDSNMFLVAGAAEDTSVDTSGDYRAFFETQGMSAEGNYVQEREFRTKLMEFLYDGKPKVFKSDTEGLIMVKISNITLSPKLELGRTIYDLSCTMTEIGAINFDALIDYKIKKGVKVSDLK
jgi:hypothetical protein